MDLNTIIKGGQLAHRRKLVLGVVAVVSLAGAYLVGDADLISAAQQIAAALVQG